MVDKQSPSKLFQVVLQTQDVSLKYPAKHVLLTLALDALPMGKAS